MDVSKTIKYILLAIVAISIITTLIFGCIESGRIRKQLDSLEQSFNEIKQSTESISSGLRQQESIITELRESQSRVESTVTSLTNTIERQSDQLDELIRNEQNVDGDIGAIISTSTELSDGIQLTLTGIREEGIQ